MPPSLSPPSGVYTAFIKRERELQSNNNILGVVPDGPLTDFLVFSVKSQLTSWRGGVGGGWSPFSLYHHCKHVPPSKGL